MFFLLVEVGVGGVLVFLRGWVVGWHDDLLSLPMANCTSGVIV